MDCGPNGPARALPACLARSFPCGERVRGPPAPLPRASPAGIAPDFEDLPPGPGPEKRYSLVVSAPFAVETRYTVATTSSRDGALSEKRFDLKARPSFEKRQKERARQQKKADKAERRQERKEFKSGESGDKPEEDPDIAGIVPGPQAPLPEFRDEPEADAKGAKDAKEAKDA